MVTPPPKRSNLTHQYAALQLDSAEAQKSTGNLPPLMAKPKPVVGNAFGLDGPNLHHQFRLFAAEHDAPVFRFFVGFKELLS